MQTIPLGQKRNLTCHWPRSDFAREFLRPHTLESDSLSVRACEWVRVCVCVQREAAEWARRKSLFGLSLFEGMIRWQLSLDIYDVVPPPPRCWIFHTREKSKVGEKSAVAAHSAWRNRFFGRARFLQQMSKRELLLRGRRRRQFSFFILRLARTPLSIFRSRNWTLRCTGSAFIV